MAKKLTLKEIELKAVKIHGDKYKYLEVKYIKNTNAKKPRSRTVITILCKEHGKFNQCLNSHFRGRGCPHCSNKKLNTKKFVERANAVHGFKYDYSKTEYTGINNKVVIICKIHGEYSQTPVNHLNNQGCSKCSGKWRFTTEEFIEKCNLIHEFKYDYSKTKYVRRNDYITIICKIHGEFQQKAGIHMIGSGCKKCFNKSESDIQDILKNNNIKYEYQKLFKDINKNETNNYRFDFYLPDYKLIIEYNGTQHYKPVKFNSMTIEKAKEFFEKQKIRDKYGRNFCKENDLNLIEIDGRKFYRNSLKEYILKLIKNNFII